MQTKKITTHFEKALELISLAMDLALSFSGLYGFIILVEFFIPTMDFGPIRTIVPEFQN